MIRLVKRHLIIPRGDTGTFTIPTLGEVEVNDIAILGIYDKLTRKCVLQKIIPATPDTLTFEFNSEDTINLEPSKNYVWDIAIYRSPIYDEEEKLIGASSIDSYYAAFSLPVCDIREVTRNV